MVDVADLTALLAGGDQQVPCPQCPKSFPNAKLLQQHQHMSHTDKSFVCEICGKAFRFRSNLAEHRSVHTALKPYVCKYCGKSSRLKGNLTKHILKHHKKEASDSIGKDDIIVKKDSSTIEFLDKTMLMNNDVSMTSLLPKEETNDQERSILISLGLDYNNSIDLRESPEAASASPENGSPSTYKQELVESEQSYGSPLPANTVGGETSLAALIASVNSPPPATPSSNNHHNSSSMTSNKTRCEVCGKHFRKREQLTMHMTIAHSFPPPESTASSEGGKTSDGDTTADDWLHNELRQLKTLITETKSQPPQSARVEQLLVGLDGRVGRLEKQVEMALNSIYTLVQLQTGMNSSVSRFKDDALEQLKSLSSQLKRPEES